MFYSYYVNDTAQDTGDNEVHRADCYWLGLVKYKTYLGSFNNCKDAVKKAKEKYPKTADGCKHCCLSCHKK